MQLGQYSIASHRTRQFILFADPVQTELVQVDSWARMLEDIAASFPRTMVSDFLVDDAHTAVVRMRKEFAVQRRRVPWAEATKLHNEAKRRMKQQGLAPAPSVLFLGSGSLVEVVSASGLVGRVLGISRLPLAVFFSLSLALKTWCGSSSWVSTACDASNLAGSHGGQLALNLLFF
jgi:hypothetical protein